MSSYQGISRQKLINISLWLPVILLFIIFVSSIDFKFRDPDSQLYSKLGREISATPFRSWIAPEWTAYSGLHTYFREHPSGVLWVTATLIKLGVPGGQAAALANFLYFLITFLFVFKIGLKIRNEITGWGMVWAVFLMPVSIQYVLRGNLEPPLAMALVIGMYCISRANDAWRYKIGFAIALALAVFFKGMQGAYVGIVGGLFWLIVERDKTILYTLLGSLLVLISVMALYEWAYRTQTGEQFWLVNFQIQTGAAVKANSIWHKPYNLLWYIARALYFALPWSIFLLLSQRNKNERSAFPRDKKMLWLLSSIAVLILIMSLFDRRADRYIYPAYTLIGMAGGWYVSERFDRVNRWLSANPLYVKISFASALLVVVVLKALASTHFYTNIQFWRD